MVSTFYSLNSNNHETKHVAQFGVVKEQEVDASAGTITEETNEKLTKLTEQDAHDIRAVIQAAGEDPQTIQMIARLKEENSEHLDELKKTAGEDILNELKMTLDELKMVDYLFKDKDRAVREMNKEGMIPPEHLKKYQKDPSLLEEDTRRAIYFRFVSLAVIGEYL